MAAAEIRVTVHVLGFEACREGNKRGQCVLAEGHEHRSPEGVGEQAQWAHIDQHGIHWGVSAAS